MSTGQQPGGVMLGIDAQNECTVRFTDEAAA
jgi:hypothetical protein